jgi:futalosine hydrolase
VTEAVLVLVPTELEARALPPLPGPIAICGFGMAEAGARAAHAIATRDEAATGVVLVGAAGTYDPDRYPVGSAVMAGRVRCHGIGAGGRSPEALGFGLPEVLSLAGSGPEILTVAEASDEATARAIASAHPDAVAEEMEGYAVAVAARQFGVPLWIVRGISNVAGDRNVAGWSIPEALHAACQRIPEVVA